MLRTFDRFVRATESPLAVVVPLVICLIAGVTAAVWIRIDWYVGALVGLLVALFGIAFVNGLIAVAVVVKASLCESKQQPPPE